MKLQNLLKYILGLNKSWTCLWFEIYFWKFEFIQTDKFCYLSFGICLFRHVRV